MKSFLEREVFLIFWVACCKWIECIVGYCVGINMISCYKALCIIFNVTGFLYLVTVTCRKWWASMLYTSSGGTFMHTEQCPSVKWHCSIYFYNVQLEEGSYPAIHYPLCYWYKNLQENWINGLAILIMQHADMAKNKSHANRRVPP